jgi:probable rRNA maturation factor
VGDKFVAGLGSQTPPSDKMNIAVANRQRTRKISLRLLKKFVNALLTELEIEKAEIGICLAAAPEMTRLNETFLKHKGSTDVITFDHSVPSSQTPDTSPQIHGEIFICVDEAVLQARKFGTSWQSEVIRYLVHGVLHLLGFEDSSAGARRKMKREENRRLREITHRFPLSKL